MSSARGIGELAPKPRISSITVVPAYGRDYKSRKDAEEAWQEGKDFILVAAYPMKFAPDREVPCSKRDFAGDCEVRIRYKNRKQITIIDNTR